MTAGEGALKTRVWGVGAFAGSHGMHAWLEDAGGHPFVQEIILLSSLQRRRWYSTVCRQAGTPDARKGRRGAVDIHSTVPPPTHNGNLLQIASTSCCTTKRSNTRQKCVNMSQDKEPGTKTSSKIISLVQSHQML